MARRLSFSQMTPEEIRQWIQTTRLALQRKIQREQVYLAHSARQGVRTPTDEAYEADHVVEADLLRLLDELEQHLEMNTW